MRFIIATLTIFVLGILIGFVGNVVCLEFTSDIFGEFTYPIVAFMLLSAGAIIGISIGYQIAYLNERSISRILAEVYKLNGEKDVRDKESPK